MEAEQPKQRNKGIRKPEALLIAEREVWRALGGLLPADRLEVLSSVTIQAQRDEAARRRVRRH
jgi:hypothetical protein